MIIQNILFLIRCDIKDKGYGIDSYTEGHIQNSIFVDVDIDLASEKTAGKTSVTRYGRILRETITFGMNNNKQVVIYDDAGGAFASRMWWMLKWLGRDDVTCTRWRP